MKIKLPLALALALTATPTLAHLNPEEHGSFMAGLSHPIFGLDHVLAMIGVGTTMLGVSHLGTVG